MQGDETHTSSTGLSAHTVKTNRKRRRKEGERGQLTRRGGAELSSEWQLEVGRAGARGAGGLSRRKRRLQGRAKPRKRLGPGKAVEPHAQGVRMKLQGQLELRCYPKRARRWLLSSRSSIPSSLVWQVWSSPFSPCCLSAS